MVMEMRSDKMIQEKINSVNDLPDGYAPNLNSKWELLQAGLKPVQNKRPLLYYIQRASAVAAMLLLIGGSGLLIIKKPTKPTASSVKTATSNGIAAAPHAKPIHQVKEEKAVVTPNHKIKNTDVNKASVAVATNPVKTTINKVEQPVSEVAQPTIDHAPKELVAAVTERFAEVDFTTPVLAPNVPTDVLVKAQKFKFKLGVGNNNQVNIQSENNAVFKLKTGL